MTGPERCPACRADLTGGPLPAGLGHLGRRSRARGTWDRSGRLAWECPDCGHRWDRDPVPAHPRKGRADETRH